MSQVWDWPYQQQQGSALTDPQGSDQAAIRGSNSTDYPNDTGKSEAFGHQSGLLLQRPRFLKWFVLGRSFFCVRILVAIREAVDLLHCSSGDSPN